MARDDLHEQSKRLFLRARALPAEERRAFLDAACSGAALRAEVESLLAQDEPGTTASTAALQNPVVDWIREHLRPPGPTPLPERIGSYRILGLLGAGGMGVVYVAEQDRPRRTVALKVIRSGLSSDALLRRFEREAQILGLLHHPGIAQVHEAGTADIGGGPQPFFAMELVPGRPLGEAQRGKDRRERLELFARICDAVGHAHERGVVHRDLKPDNILVEDGGQPRVLDFGVARVTNAEPGLSTLHTDVHQLIGTLSYMSPEQVTGGVAVDARADVYALGVILYELLTGRLPHDVGQHPIPEAVRRIREDTPTPLATLDRSLDGDLETVVATALAKEREQRYPTADALGADVRRYLRDEPIAARRPTAFYRMRKFSQRHRALVVGVVAVVAALVAGIVATSAMYLRARRGEEHAHELLSGVQTASAEMLQIVDEQLRNVVGTTGARLRLAEKAFDLVQRLSEADPTIRDAYMCQRLGDAQLSMGRFGPALDSFSAAYELREQYLRAEPESPELRRALGISCWRLGSMQLALGHFAEAMANEHRALKLFESLCEVAAARTLMLPFLAHAHRRIAEIEAMSADEAGADRDYRQSLEFCDRIAADRAYPHPGAQVQVAVPRFDVMFVHGARPTTLRALARLRADTGRAAEAVQLCEEAILANEALMPQSSAWGLGQRNERAHCRSIRARALLQLGRVEDAVATAFAAVEDADALVRLDADDFRSQLGLGRALSVAGASLTKADRPAEAVEMCKKSIACLEALDQRDPDEILSRSELAFAWHNLALAQRALAAAATDVVTRGTTQREAVAAHEAGVRLLEGLRAAGKLCAREAGALERIRAEAAGW